MNKIECKNCGNKISSCLIAENIYVESCKKCNKAITKHIGKKLRDAREAKGITQNEAAIYLGYNNGRSASFIENGVNKIPASYLWELSKLYEVPIGDFFPSEDDELGKSL